MLYGNIWLICLSLKCSGVMTTPQDVKECIGWLSIGEKPLVWESHEGLRVIRVRGAHREERGE